MDHNVESVFQQVGEKAGQILIAIILGDAGNVVKRVVQPCRYSQ